MADVQQLNKRAKEVASRVNDGALSKPVGLAAAGAALAVLPFVAEKLAGTGSKLAEKAQDVADDAKSKAKAELKDVAKDAMPSSPADLVGGGPLKKLFGGGDSDDDGDGRAAPGYGSGRRMPIQQAVDVAKPLKEVFNHWTSYEDWPEFMHRIESAEEVDKTTVSFQAKIWGISKRFTAKVLEQKPDERIEWDVAEGYAHTGVVTFHELSKNLTRVDITLDIQPSNLIDKASRGMRFAKRAVRGDLHRFKAWVELDDESKRGSRLTIEDGKAKRSQSRSQGRARRSSNGSDPKNGSRSKSRSRK
jgi:uncharacterized membrane protein